jgi:acetolactate decarboxylase
VYDGDVTIAEILQHGDFGLGTFNHLDGEMFIPDGICHHLRAVGSENLMYAIRIAGQFSEISTLTVMAQTPGYPPSANSIDKAAVGQLATISLTSPRRSAGMTCGTWTG